MKTQISLGIRKVWSESSLSTWRKLGSLATHWVHSKDSDQTGRMPRPIWVFAERTLILLVLSCCSSNDLFVCCGVYGPVYSFKVISSRSVNLLTLFLGRKFRPPKGLPNQYLAQMFLLVTDNFLRENDCRHHFMINLHESYMAGLGLGLATHQMI